MLRWAVLLLLVANLGFYAWTQGWLDSVPGLNSQGDREPERLKRQEHPDAVKLLSPKAASAALASTAPASAPEGETACLEAGPFDEPARAAAEKALAQAGVAASRWAVVSLDKPGAWLVYMGKYPSHEVQLKKEEELRRIHVTFEEAPRTPELEFGLVLGRYDDKAAADSALNQVAQRGVRTARVVTLAPPSRLHLLRAEHADAALQSQLQGLKAPALGAGFRACTTAG